MCWRVLKWKTCSWQVAGALVEGWVTKFQYGYNQCSEGDSLNFSTLSWFPEASVKYKALCTGLGSTVSMSEAIFQERCGGGRATQTPSAPPPMTQCTCPSSSVDLRAALCTVAPVQVGEGFGYQPLECALATRAALSHAAIPHAALILSTRSADACTSPKPANPFLSHIARTHWIFCVISLMCCHTWLWAFLTSFLFGSARRRPVHQAKHTSFWLPPPLCFCSWFLKCSTSAIDGDLAFFVVPGCN